ncbi:MAG TPA: hypothetical protein VKZ54_08645 [Membranihabitans sp.]|nr:hypothetical protein [Membranihabitans sp.]
MTSIRLLKKDVYQRQPRRLMISSVWTNPGHPACLKLKKQSCPVFVSCRVFDLGALFYVFTRDKKKAASNGHCFQYG